MKFKVKKIKTVSHKNPNCIYGKKFIEFHNSLYLILYWKI